MIFVKKMPVGTAVNIFWTQHQCFVIALHIVHWLSLWAMVDLYLRVGDIIWTKEQLKHTAFSLLFYAVVKLYCELYQEVLLLLWRLVYAKYLNTGTVYLSHI